MENTSTEPPKTPQRHSRIHSRNLSIFFPHPGQSPVAEGDEDGDLSQDVEAPVTVIGTSPYDNVPKMGNTPRGSSGLAGGNGRLGGDGRVRRESEHLGFTPGMHRGSDASSLFSDQQDKPVARRGHHHKHSLSHSFFSFMEPTDTNPFLSATSSQSSSFGDTPGTAPLTSPHPFLNPTDSSSSLPQPQYAPPLPRSFHEFPFKIQLKIAYAIFEFVLGACLWVDGQSNGSVSITGLGYMVCFDALGLACGVGGWILGTGIGAQGSLRAPYGTQRIEALSLFVQSIFLLFSSVYICKESIEHVLLLGHDHAGDFYDLELPFPLLVLAVGVVFFAGAFLDNHAKLVEAVGAKFITAPTQSARYKTSALYLISNRILSFFSNPFSLAVFTCNAIMLVGGLILPPEQLSNLDKALSIIETLVTFGIAYPCAVAYGQVLLQTAPPERSIQMLNLDKSLKEVQLHPLVIYLPKPHVWRVVHHQSASVLGGEGSSKDEKEMGGSGNLFRSIEVGKAGRAMRNGNTAALSGTLVVSLVVHIRADATDQNVFDITKFAYDRCASAVGAKGRNFRGTAAAGEGELTVVVKRGAPAWADRD